MDAEAQIRQNIEAHRAVAKSYARDHGEIYNGPEQERLRAALARALDHVRRAGREIRAFDFGCGAGNLTDHLIALGAATISADVCEDFLAQISARHGATGRSETTLLNGKDLRPVADESFDLVATYSVLHHVPDYLGAVREMTRILRPGGVLYIDHERAPQYWESRPEYERYLAAFRPHPSFGRRLLNLTRPGWYLLRARLLFDPRYQPEGDIHVWPDDHIEWDCIEAVCAAAGLEVVERTDYLLSRRDCPVEIYEQYRGRCVDSRMLIARKRG